MIIEYKNNESDDFYYLMIQSIIPRPIAWVLSENPDQSYNVAPFSFFNGVTSEPPILVMSVGWKDEETRKDTWINIDEREKFVVHIPPVDQAEKVVRSSAPLPLNESEIKFAELETVLEPNTFLPRIKGPKVAFYCKKHKIIEVGDEKQGLILGEIEKMWVDPVITRTEKDRLILDPLKVNPLARLGGNQYSQLSSVFEVKRPKKEGK